MLDQPGIHLAVPGMLSRKMVNENLEAIARKRDLSDILHLENYKTDLLGKACSFCAGCIDQCRFGIGGMDVARIRMYLEGYRDSELALRNGREVVDKVGLCSDCEGCSVNCSQGINIKASAQQILRFLS